MSSVDLDDLARRPQRYWDADGVPELMMGLLWIVWGAAFLLGAALPQGWTRSAYSLVAPVLLIGGGYFTTWATKRLKARLTFPRTGYVALKEPGTAARLGVAVAAMVTAMLLAATAVMLRNAGRTEQFAPQVVTVMISLAFVVTSLRQHAPHYLALAAVAAALALALGSMSQGWNSFSWVLVILGAAAASLGSLRLALFLRRHPPLEEGA